jgi:hypothetical protein
VSSSAANDGAGIYLRSYLAPLTGMLARPDVTDIYVNRPGELWVETIGGEIERHDAPKLDGATLDRLARQIAAIANQGISREHPLLSATLPDGARVQVVAPPATRGPLALAIRKHVSPDLTLDDYVAAGAFAETRGRDSAESAEADEKLAALLKAGDISGMLAAAGQSLAMFVPDDIWIVANYKETQLRHMRPGQPVEFTIDAFPGRKLTGHIASVQPGSGTAFSLLPAENATGNYVKVVQRVPVKIVVDEWPSDVPVGPGMSVVPWTRVR